MGNLISVPTRKQSIASSRAPGSRSSIVEDQNGKKPLQYQEVSFALPKDYEYFKTIANVEFIKQWIEENKVDVDLREKVTTLSEVQSQDAQILLQLSRSICQDLDTSKTIQKILNEAVTLISAEKSSLFLVDTERNELYASHFDVSEEIGSGIIYPGSRKGSQDAPNETVRIPIGSGIAGYVAKTGIPQNIADVYKDTRFNPEIDKRIGYKTRNILCYPIRERGSIYAPIIGVISFVNKKASSENRSLFDSRDERNALDFTTLCGIALHNSHSYENAKKLESEAVALAKKNEKLYQQALKEHQRNVTMLQLAQHMFKQDNVNELSKVIIVSAKELLKADQCSLFLVDHERKELYSAVFDSATGKQFKMPLSKGIVGHVASSGHLENIADAYEDKRFNKELDLATGYRTKSMLCMPIWDGEKVVGVASLINKLEGDFNTEDVELFNGFAVYCGISLHKALLLEKIKREQRIARVAMEIMAYHSQPLPEDVQKFCETEVPSAEALGIQTYYDYEPHLCTPDDQLPLVVERMFLDLGFVEKFDIRKETLCRFILTVKKNYRHVVYHNVFHAVAVSHAMYIVIKECGLGKILEPLELFAMFVAALCHDIDHRGTNNAFQKAANTPLADLYTTSTLERHHFNHCVNILSTEGNNILASLNSEQYAKALKIIETCILATDLANFFAFKSKIVYLMNAPDPTKPPPVIPPGYPPQNATIPLSIRTHLDLFYNCVMPACDLASVTKPWKFSKQTAEVVYSEFFFQGDEEKKMGRQIDKLFDREKREQIPGMQAGFISFVVEPVLKHLVTLFLPQTRFMYDELLRTKENWLREDQLLKEKEDKSKVEPNK